MKRGLMRYYTGSPCRNEHISERRVVGNACVECSRQRTKRRAKAKAITSRKWWQTVDRKHKMLLKQRHRAKARGIDFSITSKDLVLPIHCPILGIKLDYYSSYSYANNIASIDRIDSSKGYIPGNVKVISLLANRIKSDASIRVLEKILSYMKGVRSAN